ncbi:DUF6461 domain-containing protein [Streptomyces populi]
MDRKTLRKISRGTEAVVFLNAAVPPHWFLHAEGGRLMADFEPGVEAARLGGEGPGRLVPAMQAVGLLLADRTAVPDVHGEDKILEMGERHFGFTLPREAVGNGNLAAVGFAR